MNRAAVYAVGLTMLSALIVPVSAQQSPQNPDVERSVLWKCQLAGKTEYTNITPSAQDASKCTAVSSYFGIKHRPGLASYRPFYLDDQSALLIADIRTTLKDQHGDSWIMWSFARPQKDHKSGKSYDRLVAKATVQCDTHDLTLSWINLIAVHGDQEVLVDNVTDVHEEAAPNTVDDSIVAEICKGPPKQPHSKTLK